MAFQRGTVVFDDTGREHVVAMDERDKGGLLYVESQRGHYSISGRCFANTPENSLIKEFVTRVDLRLRRLRGWKDDQAVSLEMFRNLVLAALGGEEWGSRASTSIAMAAGDRKVTEALVDITMAEVAKTVLFRLDVVGHLGSPKVKVTTQHGHSMIVDPPRGFPHLSGLVASGRARSLADQMAKAG